MIQKIKDKFRDSPTWFGVTVGLTIILVLSISISLVSGWVLAERVARQAAVDEVNIAVGNRIDEFSKLLDRFEKLTITQTQNINVNPDPLAKQTAENATKILQKEGLIE